MSSSPVRQSASGSRLSPRSSPRDRPSTQSPSNFKQERTSKGAEHAARAREIAAKRQAKADAISRLDYDASAQIQQEIDELLTNDTNEVIDREKDALLDKVQEIMDAYDSQLAAVEDAALTSERDCRSEIGKKQDQMEDRHLKDLTELAVHRSVAVAKENARDTGEYCWARTKSQRLAKEDKVEDAKATLAEAKDDLKKQQEANVAATNVRYDKAVAALMKRQEADIQGLQSDLDLALERVDAAAQSGRENAELTAKCSIQAAVTGSLAKLSKSSENLALRSKANGVFRTAVAEFLQARDKGEWASER
jgi:hypothetical protein